MKRIITFIALLSLFATGLQAQIIDATNNSTHKQEKTSSNSPIYKPTGHYLRAEVGYPHYASLAYGYQLNPYFMLGAGGGYGALSIKNYDMYNYYYRRGGSWGFPLFIEAIFSTPKHKCSFIADIKFGYTIPVYDLNKLTTVVEYYNGEEYWYPYTVVNHIFGAINLGIAYKDFSLCAGISSNNTYWYSFFLSYNLPIKVH